MRFLFITCVLFAFQAVAQDPIHLKNEREGESLYAGKESKNAIARVLKKASRAEIVGIFDEVMSQQTSLGLCSYTVNTDFRSTLQSRGIEVDVRDAIYLLRETEEIDDVTAMILFKAYEVKHTTLSKDKENVFIPVEDESNKSILTLISGFEDRLVKTPCFDEAYRQFYGEILKDHKKFKSLDAQGFYLKALHQKLISYETYFSLEQGRINELESFQVTFAGYYKKLKSLRVQYPLRDTTERSNFVTQKGKKSKLSHRQRLYENYSDLQIILMANVIKNVRRRLEWTKMTISGFTGADGATLDEVITTDPMERFRGVIKLLRKDMNDLALNSYFKGRSPDYLDLVAASYEIGIISASELETVAGLSEVWSPKKTFWDKAGIWIKSFSAIATIVIPPPYGFIPALIVVVIEATSGQKASTSSDPGSLF